MKIRGGPDLPAEDGGAEARALLLPLAAELHLIVGGDLVRGAPPILARRLGLGPGGAEQLRQLLRGQRRLTAAWKARIGGALSGAAKKDRESSSP